MNDKERYITFKIETAENMNKDKIILLSHPNNELMLSLLLYKLSKSLDKFENGENTNEI